MIDRRARESEARARSPRIAVACGGVKPLGSDLATQGAPGQFNSMSTGVFAW